MSEFLDSITPADIDGTGVSLGHEGPDSRVWKLSRARAVALANDTEFQRLIGVQVARPLPTTATVGEMEGVVAEVQAINARANQLYPGIDAADLHAAWRAVTEAYSTQKASQT